MIEGLVFAYALYGAFGADALLYYYVVGVAVSWVACGFFTRGRNEELQELLASFSPARTDGAATGDESARMVPCSPASACAASTVMFNEGSALLDGASTLAPGTPAVRRRGDKVEVFAEVPRCAVNPWVNATWRVTAAERAKMALLAPLVFPARVLMVLAAVTVAIAVANVATLGWDGSSSSLLLSSSLSSSFSSGDDGTLRERAAACYYAPRRRRLPFFFPRRRGGGEAAALQKKRRQRWGGVPFIQPAQSAVLRPDAVRMPRWRLVIGRPVLWCVRFLLCALGYWRIDVEGALDGEAKVIVCNHLSMIEPLVLLYLTAATPVASAQFAKLPALGPVGKLHQLLWLDRADPASRQAVVQAIETRCYDFGAPHNRVPEDPFPRKEGDGDVETPTTPTTTTWPPILVFPEGTTLNGRALISFKTGAFAPGAPVQPVVASLPFRVRGGCGLDCSWTTAGPQLGELFVRMMLQPWNRVSVVFQPRHDPVPEERADAQLFADNVRTAMANALGVPTTDHSWADMWLNMTARDLGEPPHTTLVELSALESVVGERYDRQRALVALRRFATADGAKRGRLDLAQFVAALSDDDDDDENDDDENDDDDTPKENNNGGDDQDAAAHHHHHHHHHRRRNDEPDDGDDASASRSICRSYPMNRSSSTSLRSSPTSSLARDDDGDGDHHHHHHRTTPRKGALYDAATLETLFSVLSTDGEEVSFFEFLVGFALLDVGAAASHGGLRLLFKLLDVDGEGLVSEARIRRTFFAQPERTLDDDAFLSSSFINHHSLTEGPGQDDNALTIDEFLAFVEQHRSHLRDAWLTGKKTNTTMTNSTGAASSRALPPKGRSRMNPTAPPLT